MLIKDLIQKSEMFDMNLKPYFEALNYYDKVTQNQYAHFTKNAFIAVSISLPAMVVFKSVAVGVVVAFALYILLTSRNGEGNYLRFFMKKNVQYGTSKPNATLNKSRSDYVAVASLIFDKLAKEVFSHFHYSQSGPDFSDLLIEAKYFGKRNITYASTEGNLSGRYPSGALFTASYVKVGEMTYHNKNTLSKEWNYSDSQSRYAVDHFRGLIIYIDLPEPIVGKISLQANNVNELHQPDFNSLYEVKCSHKPDLNQFFTREHVTGLTHFWEKYHKQKWNILIYKKTLIFSKPYKKNPMWFGNNNNIWEQETKDFKVAAKTLKDLLEVFSNSEYTNQEKTR